MSSEVVIVNPQKRKIQDRIPSEVQWLQETNVMKLKLIHVHYIQSESVYIIYVINKRP